MHLIVQSSDCWQLSSSGQALTALVYVQASDATDDSSRAKAEAQVEKAQGRVAKYNERLLDAQNNPPMQIEVGSFEDVLTGMENDTDGRWDNVMFVPPGAAKMMKEAEAHQR